jgi:hypothetical protein
MTVLITLTIAGTNTGPFNLYSNLDGYIIPFASNISKAVLQAGYSSNTVPDNTLIIRAVSLGNCKNFIDIQVVSAITTTTTSSSTTSTTSTTTTSVPLNYRYIAEYHNCIDCSLGDHTEVINAEALTLGKYYYDSTTGRRILIISFDGTTASAPNVIISNASQQTNCFDVPCAVTAYTFAGTGNTVPGTACLADDFVLTLYSSDFPLTNVIPASRLYLDVTLTTPYMPPASQWVKVLELNEVIFMSITPPDEGTVLNISGC